MKVFTDTNVLVSAFATRGLCADVLRVILTRHELILSEVVVQEFRDVLMKKFRVPAAIMDDVLRIFDGIQIQSSPTKPIAYHVRDPDDVRVLAAAIECDADCLITGDPDLLTLADQVSELRIVNPRGFWEWERENRQGS
ncbi:MAG: putative toxin-antitoxin system toxin component, PIN family [Bacteroidetes bacterium]|nr:putative toxin-antitoxin system toxin component, PIN family [Bacteroidota bacterium]